jgi:glutamate racemase
MIGVFDSGIGGLTVVRALMDLLPGYDITYLGDTARTPYGSKSAGTIIKYSLNNTDFLRRQGAKLIVIACNTASSYAHEAVQSHFDGPVFEVIGPGACLAVNHSKKLRIGIIGTRATIASGVYEKRIKAHAPQSLVYATACPLLVPLVEEGWLRRPETNMIVRKYLQPLKNKRIDTLILGCTHYPVLHDVIQKKIGARVVLVDSAQAIAAQVQHYLGQADRHLASANGAKGQCQIFVTDTADQFKKSARLILKTPVAIQQADL